MTVRTRFAPSPTGYLHVGGARTALYAWLYAKHCQGQFVLRIEDTDLERSTEESVQAILRGMEWLNLDYDELHYQSQRFDRYKEVLDKLLAEGKAYRCYCSKERLETLRQQQMEAKQKPRYDGHCRELIEQQDGPFVIRFKNPSEGTASFEDKIHGTVTVSNDELDDLVLARTDGVPTYNFSVVVDDWDMQITHVIRGDDHVNNTPRQINIYNALNATPPIYIHVPMILGDDGKRLSKRHGAVGVMQYLKEGYLPEALLNYLVRLGWSHGDQEIFSREEMIKLFDLSNLNKAAASFNTEKLQWLNQQYLKTLPAEHVADELAWHMQQVGIDVSQGPALTDIVNAQAERCKTLSEMVDKSRYFYEPVTDYDEKAARKNLKPEIAPVLNEVKQGLSALATWEKTAIHDVFENVANAHELKLGKVAQPLRVAITGGTVSPPLDLTMELLGQETVVSRIDQAINHTKSTA